MLQSVHHCLLLEIHFRSFPGSLLGNVEPKASLSGQTPNYSEEKFLLSLSKVCSLGLSQISFPVSLLSPPFAHRTVLSPHLEMQALRLSQALLG